MEKKHLTISRIIIYGILIFICLACVIPIITVVSISLSTDKTLITEGYGILPKDFTLDAYKYAFEDADSIMRSYGISIFITVVGCVVGLVFNAMAAYVLSRKDYKYRKQFSVYILIPMLISGGIVPSYIWISRYLHLKDTIWVLILPMLVVPWYILLLKTFFSEIPAELIDAARVDGAGEFTAFVKIILPLSKPALATIGMFLTLDYWNNWYMSLMYINEPKLYNLQYRLYLTMSNFLEMTKNMALSGRGMSVADLPTESMRMAMCIIAAGPMLLIFPFFQKYFVRGLTVGSVKG